MSVSVCACGCLCVMSIFVYSVTVFPAKSLFFVMERFPVTLLSIDILALFVDTVSPSLDIISRLLSTGTLVMSIDTVISVLSSQITTLSCDYTRLLVIRKAVVQPNHVSCLIMTNEGHSCQSADNISLVHSQTTGGLQGSAGGHR